MCFVFVTINRLSFEKSKTIHHYLRMCTWKPWLKSLPIQNNLRDKKFNLMLGAKGYYKHYFWFLTFIWRYLLNFMYHFSFLSICCAAPCNTLWCMELHNHNFMYQSGKVAKGFYCLGSLASAISSVNGTLRKDIKINILSVTVWKYSSQYVRH